MEMPVQVVEANPQVADDTGRVAIQGGPLVYCMEEVDQPDGVSITDLAVSLGPKSEARFRSEFKNDCWEEWSCFVTPGWPTIGQHRAMLYTPDRAAIRCRADGCRWRLFLTAWSNRQQTAMRVPG
jgi:glycosyl hydrolase family 127 (putative beta-L-arabinofuranosidase)